jgi:hypothetical protein
MEQDNIVRYNFEYLSPADCPVISELQKSETVFAKDQPQYIPLRTLRANTTAVEVLSRWTLTPRQRELIASGADIFLELSTFGGPLQPIRLAVSDGANPAYFANAYGLSLDCENTSGVAACDHGTASGTPCGRCIAGNVAAKYKSEASVKE